MKRVVPFPLRSQETEWLGGRYSLPTEVRDGGRPYRPDVLLWLELPSGMIVGTKLVHPREPSSLAQSLRETLREPHAGSGLPPARIRVANESEATELRAAAEGIPIVVAPVPELDDAAAELQQNVETSEPEPSYLGDGDLEPRLVKEFFRAARLLFRAAPWRWMHDQQILRVDIPRLGMYGACLSIIGAAGENFGLMLFNSARDFEGFIRTAKRARPSREPSETQGGEITLRTLTFDRKEDLPESMLREIRQNRWPVAGPKAYPVPIALDANLFPRLASANDVRILTAVTGAFVAFFARHRDLFDTDHPEPVRESTAEADGVNVTISAPFRAFEDAPLPKPESETVPERDIRLALAISRFADRRFGPDWMGLDQGNPHEASMPLLLPWLIWTARVSGVRVADAYRDAEGERLAADDREWIDAQGAAWMSIWEVITIEPGRIDGRDLLTGETRSVHEEHVSRSIIPGDALLARVIDYRGQSYFCGLYARSLAPETTALVIDVIRSAVRRKKRAIPPERLRDPKIVWQLIAAWSGGVAHEERHLR